LTKYLIFLQVNTSALEKRALITAVLFILLVRISFSQIFTDSNLPIILITTDGGEDIPDDPRILADMKIIRRGEGQRNFVSDADNPENLDYNGRINIEVRGSTSQAFDKKQYGFSTLKGDNITKNNISLLGLPADNDWILNCMIFDPSMMRNSLCFNLSRSIGQYSSRYVYCELILNGSYRGLYLLEEKIKAGPHRVNINKIKPSDNTYPEITGGYITKADKPTGGDPVAWTMSTYPGYDDVEFFNDVPDPEDITPAQNEYIKSEFMKLESTASAGNISFENGYPSVIDLPSFIDFMLLNEISSNADAYQYSTFFHKDRSGKLRAGPLWDMDLTYGNDLFVWSPDNRSLPDVWQFQNWDNEGPKFWRDLFNNPAFNCYLSKRWNQLIQPGQPFSLERIEYFLDRTADTIGEAAEREDERWGTVGNLSTRISGIKTFLQERIAWMTANIGSYSTCSDPETPPLVITKIMYAPDTSLVFPDSKDLEFIEIKNTGSATVSLTGVYFSGTGFVYSFPPGLNIEPDESKIIAGNAEVFRAKYGFLPAGQFARSLSNKGEKLVLSDGFGNVIDIVEYSDLPPWPDASFNGYYLKLIDPLADNNIATNWIASTSALVSVEDVESGIGLKLYPSPVTTMLQIESDAEILSFELFDIRGIRLQDISVGSECYSLDMTSYPGGIYIVKVVTAEGNFVRKIVRK
jgi:hypothetical protein